eukprot:IDg23222t1
MKAAFTTGDPDLQDVNATFAIQTYCENMEEVHENMAMKEGEHHPGLSHVMEASLKLCEQRGADMRCRFKALFVLEKQMTMPFSALSKLWDVDRKVAAATVEMFKQFSLKMSEDKQTWHRRLVDSYVPVETGCRLWWEVDDDGYILANLSRHLAKALDMDFKVLLLVATDDTDDGMEHMYDVLERSWAHLSFDRSQFAFQIFGNVSRAEREKPFTARLLGRMVQF